MIRIITIGSENQICEFNQHTRLLGQKQLDWLYFQDPIMADYLYEPYIQYEVRKLPKHCAVIGFVGATKMIIADEDVL